MNVPILFCSHEVNYDRVDADQWGKALRKIAWAHSKQIEQLTYIFSHDAYIHKLNRMHFAHDALTDVITFGFSESPRHIEGEIYISIERVAENAEKFGVLFCQELGRVMIHGLLHLLGYGDETPAARREMRKKEEEYLYNADFLGLWHAPEKLKS